MPWLPQHGYQLPLESGHPFLVPLAIQTIRPCLRDFLGKKIWPWLTQGHSHFSNADPEIHLHRAMQKILSDKNDS